MTASLRFTSELWATEHGKWRVVTVPLGLSEEIADRRADRRAGFGSVRVQATIGSTTWQTSVFPESKTGCYVLPVKKSVRQAEEIDDDDPVDVALELLLP